MSAIRYSELPVRPILAPYVRLIWSLEVDAAADFGPAERIVPDAIVEIVFHYGRPFDMRYAGEAFTRQPPIAIVSQTRRFIEIRPSAPSGFLSVRFHPWGAQRFFAPPLTTLADRLTSAEDVWRREAACLAERVASARSLTVRSELVQDFLESRLRPGDASVERLVRAMWFRKRRTVRGLCDDFGIGERRLERTFAAAIGMTPKHFMRIARFLDSCRLIRGSHGTLPLAAVAQQAGYFDQSHFSADFKEFSGMTATAFAATHNVAFLTIE